MSRKTANFLNLPKEFSDPRTARYAILPVPYEGTVSYLAGTAKAPAAILEASAQVERFDDELLAEFHEAGIATYPAVRAEKTPALQMRRVRAVADKVVRAGKFLLTLGGEHSITAPLVEAVAEKYAPLSVLQIDAHADLRDSFRGTTYSHGAVMRRVLEITGSLCQVGIRDFSREEYEACPRQVKKFITPAVIASDPKWIDRVLAQLSTNVYITIDVDGFDPAVAPGTGTPQPGGLTWLQGLSLLKRVCEQRTVVAADIVEVRPIPPNQITEFMAARLAYKLISYTQH
jgi:agmatinase